MRFSSDLKIGLHRARERCVIPRPDRLATPLNALWTYSQAAEFRYPGTNIKKAH